MTDIFAFSGHDNKTQLPKEDKMRIPTVHAIRTMTGRKNNRKKKRRHSMGVLNYKGVKIDNAPHDVIPKCPYCRKEFGTIWIKTKGIGIVEQKQLILCPHCESFPGFGTFSI